MVDKARSAIVLCLRDNVLREVAKEQGRIFVYDKLFASSASPKTTTLLIQDGRVKSHHGATCGVQQNP